MKILRVVRETEETTPLRCVPTFLGAHEVPDEFIGRTDAYVELVIDEMLPLVALHKLASFCDVFCEPHIFDQHSAARILEAARTLRLWPTHSWRPIQLFRRRYAGGASGRCHRRSPGAY